MFNYGKRVKRSNRARRGLGLLIASISLLVVVIPVSASQPISPIGAAYRMNAGGPAIYDSLGQQWKADEHAIGGRWHSVTHTIAGTNDQTIFNSERWGMTGYDIPIANGTYTLGLLFAEINPTSGRRIMSVSANTKSLLNNYEITSRVAPFQSDVQRFTVNITDNILRLRFSATHNATSIAGIELIPASSTPTPLPPASPTTPSFDGWKLVASDDFNATTLDTNKWSAYEGPGNEGVGWRSPSQLLVNGGALHIVGAGNKSGGTAMKLNQAYGRWVIRAKQDAGKGYGPAILLWPQTNRWPIDGEIDIAEIPQGARTVAYSTIHWGQQNTTKGYSSAGDFTQWHTWVLEWTPSRIAVWLDGKLVGAPITTPAAIPHVPMHLALQNDVGADGHWIPGRDASTPATVALHIDYVHVYKQA